jgi:hypothetical protein
MKRTLINWIKTIAFNYRWYIFKKFFNATKYYDLTNYNKLDESIKPKNADIFIKAIIKIGAISEKRGVYGELGHPDSSIVSLSNVCCQYTDINYWFDDNVVTATVKFLDTKNGKLAYKMIESGYCNFRLRAIGDKDEVYEIITWDIEP